MRKLGFDVVGVDISEPMLARARNRDPQGDYRLVPEGDLGSLAAHSYDLVLSAFAFDNIPTLDKKVTLFQDLKRLLGPGGRIVNLVSSPEIYVNEWASFSTKDFPENRAAQCGDKVLIVMLDVVDKRPVEDILWTDEGYRDVYERACRRKTDPDLQTLGEPGRTVLVGERGQNSPLGHLRLGACRVDRARSTKVRPMMSRRAKGVAPFVGAFLAACVENPMTPPAATPNPNTQVVPIEGAGPVQMLFAGSSIPPGSTVSGCGSMIEGCKGRLRMVFELHPQSAGHVLYVRVYLHATSQIACLWGQTSALDLKAGVPARVEVSLEHADKCSTPVTLVSMDGIVEGPVEVASRQEWTLHYVFAP